MPQGDSQSVEPSKTRSRTSDTRLVVNVGLHKTGTTFLNRAVFPNLPDTVHLGKPYDADDPARLLLQSIIHTPYSQFDVQQANAKAQALIRDRAQGKKLVTISEGRLSVTLHADRYLMAERLRAVFGPATILMTLRRQQDLLSALYFQALGTGRAPIKYPDWVQQFLYHRGKENFDLLNYFTLMEAYVRAFGRENVHVFLYEQMRDDRDAYARRLALILDVDGETVARLIGTPALNPRMTKAHGALLRRPALAKAANAVKAITPAPALAVARSLFSATGRAEAKLPPDIEARGLKVPRHSNRQLVERYGLPLEAYGYPL